MNSYSVREAEELSGVSRGAILRLIRAGFVDPERGPRREYRFSFQDLVVMRTAQDLFAAKLPARRISRSLKQLRAQLPDELPLSGLRISAEGDRIVITEGLRRWQAESGQYLLDFEVAETEGTLKFLRNEIGEPQMDAEEWFESAYNLEEQSTESAKHAYRQAIARDSQHLGAHINLGRLLHHQGNWREAERVYRNGIVACGADAELLFNLGVLLEDMGRKAEAVDIYRGALRREPHFADCHYNLALLLERAGRKQEALRHLREYQKLTHR